MNKQTTIRAVARQTGLTYFEAQMMLETLLEVWSEALVQGEQISMQDFLTIKVTELKPHRRGKLQNHTPNTTMPKKAYRVDVRMSQKLKHEINRKDSN